MMWADDRLPLRRGTRFGSGRPAVATMALLGGLIAISSQSVPSDQVGFNSLAFSPDGRLLGAIGPTRAYLWNTAGGGVRVLKLPRQGTGVRLAFSRDDRMVVTGSNVGSFPLRVDAITLWDVATGQRVRGFPRWGALLGGVALSPDAKLLAVGTFGLLPRNKLRVWNLRTGRNVAIPGHRGLSVSDLEFSPDGSRLAVLDAAGVTVLDISSRKEDSLFRDHGNAVSLAFSPDGTLLVTTHADGSIRLWDAGTWKLRASLTGHAGAVGKVAFSADGKTLASSGLDATVRVWDVASGTQLRAFEGRPIGGTTAFSPDGKTLYSASLDGTMTEWDIDTGRPIRTFSLH